MENTESCRKRDLGSILNLSPRYAGWLGLVSLAVFIVCWIIGAWADEDWVLFEDTVCYLGVSDIMFIRVMYPISCTVTGIGIALFGCNVARASSRRLQVIGYYLCIGFGISLIGIGLLNIDFAYIPHMVFVYSLGVFAGFVMGLTAIDDFRNGNRITLPFFVFVLVGFFYFTFFDMSYQQPFVFAGMFLWLICKCIHLIVTDTAY